MIKFENETCYDVQYLIHFTTAWFTTTTTSHGVYILSKQYLVLVNFASTPRFTFQKAYDEKNIRRRVYDALNVLMAMDIILKVKKEITWKGLPSNAGNLI